MGNDAPKPIDDLPHPCGSNVYGGEGCGKLTRKWYSHYPKSKKIYYSCDECHSKGKEENAKRIAQLTESSFTPQQS